MVDFGYLLPTRGSVLASDDAQTLAAKTAADVIGLARRAEALGFGSVWVGDSVLAKPRHDPLTTLAAVATATEAVDLGTAVHLPPLRHPVHVAHRTATLAQLAGGRLRWGIGVGRGPAVEAEYANLGVPFAERGARLDELLEIVTRLWGGGEVDFAGDHYALEGASLGFAPPERPSIYVATSAYGPDEPIPRRVRDRLAAHGDGWLPIAVEPEPYADGLARVREAVEAAGRPPGAVHPAMYLDVVIDDEPAAAIGTARTFYEAYYPDRGPLVDADIRALGVFGDAATVSDAIGDYADAGAETVVIRFTAPDQRTQLRRFADLAL